ncbi:MAG: 50S ribosomal protein L25 [Planctomycetota bacterium]
MSEVVLKAGKRTAKKKEANARLRAEGKIPAIVYGKGEDNIDVSVETKEFLRLLDQGQRMLKLDIEGEEKSVLVKDVQYGTYGHRILHADFRAVNEDTVVHISVSVEIEGVAAGATDGGIVDHELHTVPVECKAKNIPNIITVDISGLGVGDTLTLADVPAPEGVKFDMDMDAVVASCHMPVEEAETEEAGEGEGSVEPEVIGEAQSEEEKEE